MTTTSYATPKVTLYHMPQTRSLGVLVLLEELGVPYDLKVLDSKTGENRQAPFLAINPQGKVPTVVHNGAVVTEQVAIFTYLADLYPEAKMSPALTDPLRGPFLRWMAFYGSSFEPAIVDKSRNAAPAGRALSPYGDFDDMWNSLTGQLAKRPYMLGDQFTALDALWGTALGWTTTFGLAPETPVTRAYIDRIAARPASVRALKIDADLMAKQA
jgi:glutathione S-transferase